MNILPKKKWHVRTKENMARVRRDEAKAAAEEAVRAERATLAEHEDRVRRLKSRAADSYGPSMFDRQSTSAGDTDDRQPASSSAHVNFFEELEVQERQNLQKGNKEYEAEKKKEYNDWESKMGIMKRFAEDTKEYSKDKYWWECIPLVRQDITDGFINNFAKNIVPSDPQQKLVKSTDKAPTVPPVMKRHICEHIGGDVSRLPKAKKAKTEAALEDIDPKKMKELTRKARKKLRKEEHEKRKQLKKQRRRERQKFKEEKEKHGKNSGKKHSDDASDCSDASSSSSSNSCASVVAVHNTKQRKGKKQSKQNEVLSQLRAERLNREKQEKERAKTLFQPKKAEPAKARYDLDSERSRKYNTQFNPELAK